MLITPQIAPIAKRIPIVVVVYPLSSRSSGMVKSLIAQYALVVMIIQVRSGCLFLKHFSSRVSTSSFAVFRWFVRKSLVSGSKKLVAPARLNAVVARMYACPSCMFASMPPVTNPSIPPVAAARLVAKMSVGWLRVYLFCSSTALMSA